MKVKNAVMSSFPVIPDRLKEHMVMMATYPLTDTDIRLYNMALYAICKQMDIERIENKDLTRVNIIFTEDGSFAFTNEDKNTYGSHASIITYSIKYLNDTNNLYFILYAFIEELVHHFWKLDDEYKVKYKTVEIAQIIDPVINIEMIDKWGVNWE